ncbi:MAG TPA: DUF937 domain-containing protein [Gemmatimonadaceae bacterium]
MSGIFDIVQQQLSGGAVQQVAERTGINPALAQKAVTAAIPMILGGMAKHAAEPGNAAAIHAEADNHVNSAGVLGDLPAIFTGSGTQGGLLNKAMGQHHEQVQDGVAKAAGIDKAQAAKVVAVVAPVVLGAIALKKRQGQLTADQIPGSLQQAQQQGQTHAENNSPGLGGVLGSVMGQIMNREGPRA